MNLIEILSTPDNDAWFRPIAWRGTRMALCRRGGRILIVPTFDGGREHMTSSIEDILGEWEFVKPDDVNRE